MLVLSLISIGFGVFGVGFACGIHYAQKKYKTILDERQALLDISMAQTKELTDLMIKESDICRKAHAIVSGKVFI
jgi:hypothetical protein